MNSQSPDKAKARAREYWILKNIDGEVLSANGFDTDCEKDKSVIVIEISAYTQLQKDAQTTIENLQKVILDTESELRKTIPSPSMDGQESWNHTQRAVYRIKELVLLKGLGEALEKWGGR